MSIFSNVLLKWDEQVIRAKSASPINNPFDTIEWWVYGAHMLQTDKSKRPTFCQKLKQYIGLGV